MCAVVVVVVVVVVVTMLMLFPRRHRIDADVGRRSSNRMGPHHFSLKFSTTSF